MHQTSSVKAFAMQDGHVDSQKNTTDYTDLYITYMNGYRHSKLNLSFESFKESS